MSSTIRTLGAGALGALLVAVAVLALRPTPVVGAPATDTTPAQHTITVSGSGKVTIVPDVARITLGVTISKPTVKAVRDAGAKAMTDVIAAIKGLGVADADIQTTNLSLYPQYGNSSVQKIIGYQISEQVLVTVRDSTRPVTSSTRRRPRAPTRSMASRSSRAIRSRRRTTTRRRGGRGQDQRPGDGRGGQRLARRCRLDHRRLADLADLVRGPARRLR